MNLRIAEILLENSPADFWKMLKQINVNEAVGILPKGHDDWRKLSLDDYIDYSSLAKYKRMINEYDLKLSAIEDNPSMFNIMLGLPGKEEELNNIAKMIENFGKLGIETWCYNWSILGWIRTRINIKTRGGATVSGYYNDDLKSDPAPVKITASELWKNLKDFLDIIIPVAENSNVKLAMHPDDPPLNYIREVPRIMNSIESYDKLLNINKSKYNGITLCQGNFTLMTDDLPEVIRHFNDKIFFVHFRDVSGDKYNFHETFIDSGKTDMLKCLRAYKDIDFNGIMRTDHTPTLSGDKAIVPGYSYFARLHAIGYIQGMFNAIK